MINIIDKLNKIPNYTYFISEIGLNHNGSVEIAKKLVKIAKESGSDAVKFQKRDVDNLAIKEILDTPDDRFPEFGSTYREIRKHIEFNNDEYIELKEYSLGLSSRPQFSGNFLAKYLINLSIDLLNYGES